MWSAAPRNSGSICGSTSASSSKRCSQLLTASAWTAAWLPTEPGRRLQAADVESEAAVLQPQRRPDQQACSPGHTAGGHRTERTGILRSVGETVVAQDVITVAWQRQRLLAVAALPGVSQVRLSQRFTVDVHGAAADLDRSEEHTSELQSRGHLVCRLLLEKKK